MKEEEKEVDILFLEGLALNGFIKDIKIEKCSSPDNKLVKGKLIAHDINNNKYVTKCMDYGRVSRSYLVIVRYIEWGKYIVMRK
ncbi:MAG TPA: hypothetical protein EYP32_07270 [Aquificaceae bacterium]|nr:hypothetical protein [Aquificaceae bacterium]